MNIVKTILALSILTLARAAGAGDAPPPNLPACPTDNDKPAMAPLLERIEQTMEGRSLVATSTMQIKTKSWSRKLKMKIWTKGRDYALIRILDGGPRETGMMTLKREKQLWNYLPRAGRVMKLPSGMLGDSWMGSDLTNDDLVRGTSMVDDFDAKLAGTAKHEGHGVWRVTLVPKPKAVVVWGKIDMLVDRASCVPLLERFYDEDGELARTMTLGDIRTIGWRKFPARIAVKPVDGGRQTIVTYQDIEFDAKVADDTFSLHRLQQGR